MVYALPSSTEDIVHTTVVDLEIFRGGFRFTKMPAKLEVNTKKKKVITSFLSYFLLAAASLPFSTAPKPTH